MRDNARRIARMLCSACICGEGARHGLAHSKDTFDRLGRQIVASSSARPIIIRYSPGLLDSLFSVTWCLRPWGVEHERYFCARQLARLEAQ
jgi:hypothetical protein